MNRIASIIVLSILVLQGVSAQRKVISLPDLPGYVTLKCDFHMHTVFSDGSVWPLNRVSEAWRDGLDAIAITDHIENTPKKDYIPVDHDAAWKISQDAAREKNILLVHGAEITRKMPPGHFNALFIQDASALARDSVMDAIEEAVRQGAFILWNHPGWRSQEKDGIPKLYSKHKLLLSKGWLHGIEYFNEFEYYPLVMDFCRTYNLAVICNSDVHDIISEEYPETEYRFRPMTLVFSKEKTVEGLKEAMMAGRTLAFFRDTVAGKEEYLKPFFYASLLIGKVYYQNNKKRYFEITNTYDIPWHLVRGPEGAPAEIHIAARSVTRVELPAAFSGQLVYDVGNAKTGSSSVLRVELKN